jgi:hypothetical protein
VQKEQNQDDDDEQPNPSMGTVSDTVTTSWERAQQSENQDDEQNRVDHGPFIASAGRCVDPFSVWFAIPVRDFHSLLFADLPAHIGHAFLRE